MHNEHNPTRRHVVAAGAVGAVGLTVAATSLTACGAGSGSGGAGSGGAGSGGSGSGKSAVGGALVKLSAVPVGKAVAVKGADGTPVIIAQPTAGTVVAFSAICTHRGCTVAPSGAKLVCPCHQSAFDALTGKVLNGPAASPLPTVAVTVKGEDVVAG